MLFLINYLRCIFETFYYAGDEFATQEPKTVGEFNAANGRIDVKDYFILFCFDEEGFCLTKQITIQISNIK